MWGSMMPWRMRGGRGADLNSSPYACRGSAACACMTRRPAEERAIFLKGKHDMQLVFCTHGAHMGCLCTKLDVRLVQLVDDCSD